MPISKHEEKMINLRTQLQQNQTELHDYLADLDSWGKEIRQKDEQLKTASISKSQDLPPVRNTLEKKKMKKKKKERKTEDQSNKKKISGYDFRAWDKFDVDKALAEIDEKKDRTSSSEYETDEEWEMERKKHLAGIQKDKGNESLKNGDCDKAIEAYTKGMEFDPTNAILPANRAMALLKQEKFAAAELDCTTSISLDPLYVKAYLRRATARSAMGKFDDAVADYKRVLDLESTNKQAKSEIERLQKELVRAKDVPIASTLTEEGKGIVKPVYKQPEERSKAPLKRIFIEEIGMEPSCKQHPASIARGDVAKKITAKEEENFDNLLTSVTQAAITTPQSSVLSSTPEHNSLPSVSSCSLPVNSKPDCARSQHQEDSGTISMKPKIENQDFSKSSISSLKTEKRSPWSAASNADNNLSWSNNKQPRSDTETAHSQGNSPSNAAVEDNRNNLSEENFSIPQTSFQLQTDFKLLKDKPESFFQYFQAIPPAQYIKLFGQCLDADILTAILKSLATNCDRLSHDLYEILLQLTQVKRFSMTVMFLSQKDKQFANSLMEHLSKSGSRSQNDILSLSRKYDL